MKARLLQLKLNCLLRLNRQLCGQAVKRPAMLRFLNGIRVRGLKLIRMILDQ